MFHGEAGPNYCSKLLGQYLALQTNLMNLLTFLAPIAQIGLVHGGLENVWGCCVMGNSSTNAWRLHAPVLFLLVLPQKSNMSQDLSASEWRTEMLKHLLEEDLQNSYLIIYQVF